MDSPLLASEEFARIIVVKKDGTDGAVCPILGDIVFGRDKDCDVRVKIPSVSRQQFKVTADENGQCFLIVMSTTNPTFLNGNAVSAEDKVVLSNGDKIHISERSFIFQNGKTAMSEHSKEANDKLVLKQVAKVESIDESLTTNFAAVIPTAVKNMKSGLSTIVESVEESPAKHPAKSPLKASKNAIFEAIRARRKSGSLLAAKSPLRKLTPQKKSSSSISTPLRKAIEARRKSAGISSEAAPSLEKNSTPKSAKKSLYKSAFMKEIEARRKSYTTTTVIANATPEKSAVQMEVEESVVIPVEVVPEVRPTRSSFLRQIEARRKSYGETSKSPAKQVVAECISSCLETTTPAKSRKSIGRKSVGRKSLGLIAEVKEDEEVVIGLQSPSAQMTISSEEIVAASCTQLAVDAMAVKLESKGNEPEAAYDNAINTFLSSPAAFMTDDVEILATQQTPSKSAILMSVMNAGVASARKTPGRDISTVIGSLSEAEMSMLDNYANQIVAGSEGEIEQTEAFGLAIDSFVRGMEQCNDAELMPTDESPFFGASLNTLFKLPSEFSDEFEVDMELVTRYAEELQEAACIDQAVAYGIALDTYLADPAEFRERLGSQSTEAGCKSPEFSIMQTVVRPNTHIHFPDEDISSPVRSAMKSARKSTVSKSVAAAPAPVEEVVVPEALDMEEEVTSAPVVAEFVEESVSVMSPVRSAMKSARKSTVSKSVAAAPAPVEEVVVPEALDMEEEVTSAPVVEESVSVISPTKRTARKSIPPKSFSPTFTGSHAEVAADLSVQLAPCDTCSTGKRKAHTRQGACKLAKASIVEMPPVEIHNEPSACQEIGQLPVAASKGSKKRGAAVTAVVVEQEPVSVVVEDVQDLPQPTATSNKRSKKGSKESEVVAVVADPAPEPEPEAIEEPTKGKRKASKTSAPAPAPKVTKPSKKTAVVEEEDDEEALVLICDGCENEYFYDELYPKGDFKIPDGDWFCTSCAPSLGGKKKSAKTAAPKKAAQVESPVPVAKGKGKSSAVKVEEKEEPRRNTRRK